MNLPLKILLHSCLSFIAVQAIGSASAFACSPPLCSGGGTLLFHEAVVPAGLQGIAIDPLTANFNQQHGLPFDASDFYLLGGDGHRVNLTLAGTHRAGHSRLMRFAEPLRPGVNYAYYETYLCGDKAGMSDSQQSFTVTSSAIPTTRDFALSASSPAYRDVYYYHSARCYESYREPTTRIQIELPAAWEPWRHLLKTDLFVDGKYFEYYPRELHRAQSRHNHPQDLFARCNGQGWGGLLPGQHLVRAEVSLAGFQTIYSSTISINLSCSLPDLSLDAGVADSGTVTDGGVASDAGGSGSGGLGCTCSPPPPKGRPWILWGLASPLALFIYRRRRSI